MSKHKEASMCVWRGGGPPSHNAMISSVDPGVRRALPSPAPSWVPVGRFLNLPVSGILIYKVAGSQD